MFLLDWFENFRSIGMWKALFAIQTEKESIMLYECNGMVVNRTFACLVCSLFWYLDKVQYFDLISYLPLKLL